MRRAGILSLFHRWHCRLYRILSFYDSFQIWRHAGIIFLTHRWLYRLYHILSDFHRWHYRLYHILSDFFSTLPPAGGNFTPHWSYRREFFPFSRLATLTPQRGNFAPQCCLRRDFFPTQGWQHWPFQTWRRRGGGHVTWEVEGVILFLRNRLPPLAYASHITTEV